MLRYSIKRILLALLTVLIIAAITFFAMNAIPGGPFSSEKAIDPATLAALEARYGLDKPLGEQFVNYLRNLLHGDLGVSLKTGREISDVIGESFGVSARLGLMAALIAVVAGLVLGSIAALCRGKWPDRIIIFVTTLFVSVPSFVLATILLLVNLFAQGDVTWSLIVVPAILIAEVLLFKKWCHKLCPLSAFMSLIAKLNRTFKPTIDNTKCLETAQGKKCGACGRACDEGIDPRHPELSEAAWSECTKCRSCMDACPAHAISMPLIAKKGEPVSLKGNDE